MSWSSIRRKEDCSKIETYTGVAVGGIYHLKEQVVGRLEAEGYQKIELYVLSPEALKGSFVALYLQSPLFDIYKKVEPLCAERPLLIYESDPRPTIFNTKTLVTV